MKLVLILIVAALADFHFICFFRNESAATAFFEQSLRASIWRLQQINERHICRIERLPSKIELQNLEKSYIY